MNGETLQTKKILLVTGLSGAGKTTVLKTLEDMGWEAVDNFPIRLLERLINTPLPAGRDDSNLPLAIGFDSRTRGFEPAALIESIKALQNNNDFEIMTVFLDCSGSELQRRYTETRRRHPMAEDRSAQDGIAQERAIMEPLRRWAEHLIDTTHMASDELQREIRTKFSIEDAKKTNISITSFGFSRGVPPNADLVFDMRFLRNPHWDSRLKPKTGLDQDVADYVRADESYAEAMTRILDLLKFLLPQYIAGGKAYVNIAFGCTGGRHRSVHVADQFSKWLHEEGFSPTVAHRNLASRPSDALEGSPNAKKNAKAE